MQNTNSSDNQELKKHRSKNIALSKKLKSKEKVVEQLKEQNIILLDDVESGEVRTFYHASRRNQKIKK